jgi:hypothetical protein
MSQHAIDKQQIMEVIKKGAKVKQTDGLLSSYGYIKVAYKIRGEKYIIKTVIIG